MGNKNNPLSREASEGYCVNRAGGVYNPPSCRFPPLREGNRAGRRTLWMGFSFIRAFVNFGSTIGIATLQELCLSK